ncbi:sodium-dependent transporter [bacterium]|nr:MAG: sodium-dependent transporter [bacterium]
MKEQFSSRWGLILSVLGIAIGTGNIWRFPRIASQNAGADGAGAFLFAWVIFLFMWSVPLIIAEYAIGKSSRRSLASAFALQIGNKFAWMGSFVGFVAIAIMFYYSVVTGWCMYYFGQALLFPLPSNLVESKALWDGFQSSGLPVVFHFLAMLGSGLVVMRGIKSIEKVNKVLIPVLILILLVSLGRALTLPDSWEGVRYLFTPDWATLKNPGIWLEALTQNAWDTGAGWGLILTYAIYMQKSDSITTSAFQTGIGNNVVSMIAAIIIFSTVFSILGAHYPQAEILSVMKDSGPASTGLTFIWMPQLFLQMPGGSVFAVLFFLGLSFAAFSSLISMVELATTMGKDVGIDRKKAVIAVTVVGFLAGIPSASNLTFFANQDFVWGLGLMISGAFIAFVIIKHDVLSFRTEKIYSEHTSDTLGKWWDWLIQFIIPIEAIVLLGWWMFRSAVEFSPDTWYNPFDPYSVASCVVQWALLMGILIFTNKKMLKKLGI